MSYFIKERGLRQADLKSVASQSIISELINGKRVMNIDQVKGFAAFFDVPVETFMGT
ncbi:TPA: helix-turn-helix transcriptional regulator [Klebsiella pneumoniae]|nr:helix-turn-helix transcriptional regulator [Escherichia coli]MBL9648179.1 helix-turn-helix transcriptional regulator [Klebsiella pneumoniae]MBR7596844.1 helix-turn-helix transcriptional regulator [Klebsiella oxytoca]MBR8629652.1 helix-turn-helix transcriptional regulator [Klebsiella pneumoniae subsp. pneumoniae]MBV2203730.1 helix-turn-helix transcriptional regulator [Klebsiella variicola]MCK6040180.1 helix-turn-helix transcriptional regulator [Klebsiella quasipneumoniae]HDT6053679.1 helix-